MKNLIYAAVALFGVLITVIATSILLCSNLRELEDRIEAYSLSSDPDYERLISEFAILRDSFEERAPTLSLLVSDDALLEVEHSFSDVLCYAEAESYEGVISSINRLQIDLEHLRELAGFNIKSVF